MKWHTVLARVAPPVALSVGAALVDVGVLDARLYRGVAQLLAALGVLPPLAP